MITFNDVRREQTIRFFFFPDGMQGELAYLMEQARIPRSEYKILDRADMMRSYPGTYVPLVPTHPSLAYDPDMLGEALTMVSYMNPDDLSKKFWEFHDSADAIAYNRRANDERAAIRRERDARLEGWLPGLDRAHEGVR